MAITPIIVRDGNNAAQSMGAFQDPAAVNYSAVSVDSAQAVYRASANFTPLVTAAVALVSIKGSASKTIRIKRITIGGVSTALSASVFQLLRTTTVGTGGTVVTPTAAKLDTSTASAAATAVVQHYTTAAQSSGSANGGPLSTQLVTTSTVTTPTVGNFGTPQVLFPEGGAPIGQAIVLRGAADILEIQNVAPTNLGAGSVLTYTVEWVEDAS
jgi:hypothetical protein